MFFCTDIHTHILYGIDDGARDEEMCMRMLESAEKDGIGKIILTPHSKPMHHNASPAKIRELAEELRKKIRKSGSAIELYTGNELYYHSGLLELLEEGEVCTLADSEYVLLEFGPMDDFGYIRKGIYQILSGGYRPILAHAERYSELYASAARIKELTDMGCYIQINRGSVIGQYGFRIKRYCLSLLKLDLVHFVASDAHDDKKRRCLLSDCADYVNKKFGQQRAERIFVDNPARVIAGDYI